MVCGHEEGGEAVELSAIKVSRLPRAALGTCVVLVRTKTFIAVERSAQKGHPLQTSRRLIKYHAIRGCRRVP